MEPALTKEEWARFPDIAAGEPVPGEEPLYHWTPHGIAAANLHGQSFGFTWEDVEWLRDVDVNEYIDPTKAQSVFRDLADRIEALLPPKDQT